jgi:hypothetical protein
MQRNDGRKRHCAALADWAQGRRAGIIGCAWIGVRRLEVVKFRAAMGVILSSLALSAAANAQELTEREALALEVVELTNADAVAGQIGAQMRSMMMRQTERLILCDAMRPAVEDAVDEMTDVFTETMNSVDLRAQMAVVYAETFSEDELREIAAFYRSEAGRRLVEAMPELMRRSMTLGEDLMATMQSRLEETMNRHAETFARAAERCEAPPG